MSRGESRVHRCERRAAAVLDKEREILAEQTKAEKKPPEIIAKMVEGRLRKYLGDHPGRSTLVRIRTSRSKLLKNSGATVLQFVRYAVGEGIEKKQDDFRRRSHGSGEEKH